MKTLHVLTQADHGLAALVSPIIEGLGAFGPVGGFVVLVAVCALAAGWLGKVVM